MGGHSLRACWTARDQVLVYCCKCGAYAEERSSGTLFKPCRPSSTPQRAYDRRRLEAGLHPHSRRREESLQAPTPLECDLIRRVVGGTAGWADVSSSSSVTASIIRNPRMDALVARLQAKFWQSSTSS
eukprot:6921354-Pyramimonas_sp.AAC.1